VPRINAATVAEHRVQQRAAILTAARELLAETGAGPSLAAVGERAGLARSSVYAYFSSREDLLAAVVDQVLPDWSGQVVAAMRAAESPAARVWAYVTSNVELFESAEQAAAQALTRVVDPAVLAEPMASFHDRMRAPLVEALHEMGEPEPSACADLIGALVVRVTHVEGAAGTELGGEGALALLQRMLGHWLGR
jgi:AcrR family transcriptional regulator